MGIIKINEFWVPEDDTQLSTQKKCLSKFKEWCRTQHKHFETVIDVGAWTGTWAVEMKEFAGRLYAFEPSKITFECLEKNLGGYDNINCNRFALGDKDAEVSLVPSASTQAIKIDEKPGNVQMKTIDSFELKNVQLIKLAVQGYEMKVLEGASKTLETVQYIMIELNGESKNYGSSNEEIENHLKDLGFYEMMDVWPDKIFCR